MKSINRRTATKPAAAGVGAIAFTGGNPPSDAGEDEMVVVRR